MTRLIRAELLKVRSIRTFWWAVAAALAFVPVSIALAIGSAGIDGNASLESSEGFRNVLAAASSGGILVMIIGIMMVAGEFRFNTVTSTFLVTPDRTRVVSAKLAASAIVGVAIGMVASALTVAISLPWLSSRHVDLAAHGSDIAFVLLGGIAATAIGGPVGVGIGAMLTNQTLAVTATLIWVLLVEQMLAAFSPGVARWFPGGAASAMSGVRSVSGSALPLWAGALVFAGYGLVFSAAGTRFLRSRDIT
jgi:hypothetical protein